MEEKNTYLGRLRNLVFVVIGVVIISQLFVPSFVTHSATLIKTKFSNRSNFVSPAIGPNLFKLNYSNEFAIFVPSSGDLIKTFDKANFQLKNVINGKDSVPRIYVSKLPHDIGKVVSINQKKSLYIRILLPLILQVNEDIENDRDLIRSLMNKHKHELKFSVSEASWLIKIFERYDLKLYDFKGLLIRHDIIPPSLALAQSIIESGWGTSRFAINGNAIFGQWTFKTGTGLVPLKRSPGKAHEIKSFDKLEHSVEQYIFNLNYHRAYKEFRNLREKMRKGNKFDSFSLAGTLESYSEKRDSYVELVKLIMQSNNLNRLDTVKFREYF
ncbi:MAG: hypothetical protein CMM18_00675 [Rhodospirillaceae bacterium]|nr:hypothetical protein [Rhodospirillaceae bacterium]